jgi:outer membrane protein OmpA-like peptidoglycan-associated protein
VRYLEVALAAVLAAGCATGKLPLKQVTLYGNGLGYFERAGELSGGTLKLRLSAHEIDDVLKTLAVLSDDGSPVGAVAAVESVKDGATLSLTLPSKAGRQLRVGYAAPTPAWTPIYRAILDVKPGEGRLQAWAIVHNASDEDWDGKLVLVTGAPFSLAVDLHTPQFVARPDATGKLVTPTLTAAIQSQSVRSGDQDGDGILDENDLCPRDPEDKDGFEDGDGCPDPDNDKDRILDKDDKCPNEPETYNGFEDDDGCPDRGRVVISHSSLEILDNIYFISGSAEIKAPSLPIVDAVAATMKGNPSIRLMEVGGHAADNEKDPDGLGMRRAVAIVAALAARGVERDRLRVNTYGATRPARPGSDDKARAVNRRVGFVILKRDDASRNEAPAFTGESLSRSVAPVQTKLESGAGMVRYAIESDVRVPRHSASLVAILSEPVSAEEVYFYRPTSSVPGSDHSPLRGARIVGPKGATLEPGPIALYARGGFVGDALLDRLYPGQIAYVPFALDKSTVVRHSDTSEREPVRVVSIARGKMTVEDRLVRRTKYEVATGADAPARIYLEHPRELGSTARNLIGGTETTPTSLQVPLALRPNDHANITVEEVSAPRSRELDPSSSAAEAVAPYLTDTALPLTVKKALEEMLTRRRALERLEADEQRSEERMVAAVERRAQLDENLRSLKSARGAEALKRELQQKLGDAVKLADAASVMHAKAADEVNKVRAALEEQARALSYDAPATK